MPLYDTSDWRAVLTEFENYTLPFCLVLEAPHLADGIKALMAELVEREQVVKTMQMQHARIMDEMEGVMEHMRGELRDMKRRVCVLEREIARLMGVEGETEPQGMLGVLMPWR
jgi:hypothetical protein